MKNEELFEIKLSAPALRALANAKVTDLKQLTAYTEKEVAKLHSVGNNAIAKIKEALSKKGLSFKKQ